MDTSDPDIVFDENGVCNHCKHYSEITERLPENKKAFLAKTIQKMKRWGRNKPFDCLLGVGGGVDCSFTAYVAYKLGLRVLLFHLDNGYNTAEAEYNIKVLTEKTGFQLIRCTLDFDEFNDVVLSFMKASVIDIEVATDHAAAASLFKIANQKRIKFMLTGTNVVTEAVMPQTWGYRKNDLPNLMAIHRQFGKVNLATYPTINILKLAYYQTIKGIHVVPLLNYLSYNREKAKKTLRQFCGWRDYGLKHYENIWTRFYQRYILPRKFHVDKRRAHLSTLICSGQLTREQALKELEKPLYAQGELKREKTFVLGKLGLKMREFDRLMKRRVKQHREYASDEWLYKLLKNSRAVIAYFINVFRSIRRRKR